MGYKKVILQIIKDEHSYLKDWIEYHSKYGFDFILVEDYFSSSHKDICDKYDNVKLVKLFDFVSPERKHRIIEYKEFRQYTIFEEFYYRNKSGEYNYDFCLFIDPDEFLTNDNPNFGNLTIEEINEACDYIRNNEISIDAISLRWKMMTSNNLDILLDKNPDLSIPIYERFTDISANKRYRLYIQRESKLLIDLSKDIKLNPIDSGLAPHVFGDKKNIEKFYKKLYLNHYQTKSITEYIRRVNISGDMVSVNGGARTLNQFINVNRHHRHEIYEYMVNNNLLNLEPKCNIF